MAVYWDVLFFILLGKENKLDNYLQLGYQFMIIDDVKLDLSINLAGWLFCCSM